MELVAATANPDKHAEMAAILATFGVVLLPRPASVPEVEETGETLEENARLKAEALAAASGRPSVADDTGLEVESLANAPGVRSARFAGEHASYSDNVDKLLRAMSAHPALGHRRARFRTVALVAYPDGRELSAEGVVDGHIAPERRGHGGFGYDPVFVPEGAEGRTFAQMEPEEKHAVSHRGRAFRALGQLLSSEENPHRPE